MYYDQTLLYEKGYSITVNNPSAPLYYYFDYDTRVYNINMDFQHFHQFYEIFVLLDEKVGHIIEGDYYPLHQYDIVLLRPMLLHKTEYPEGPPSRRLIIDFAIPHCNSCLDGMLQRALSVFDVDLPIFRFSPEPRSQVFDVLNDIFKLQMQRPAMMDLLVHSKFVEFLCRLYGCRDQNLYVQDISPDSITQRIYTITSYIHSHFDRVLSLDALAKRIFVSPYYLSHQFRQVTGFTLVNYIQMTRVRNAQQYLLGTNMKIAEVTERCGFTSFSQFNRVFHKFCQTSPSQFRADSRREGARFNPVLSSVEEE
ncbi:AraC family transcriptional regulator [Spirochaetia bacterium]|nr:AraC family transcriptional regulator [Spirochaetia bacterium]